MKKVFLALAAITLVTVTSCKDDKKGTDGTTTENVADKSESSDSESSDNLYTDVKTLNKAEEELKNLPKFKGKEIKVFQKIYFYDDGRIVADLQDPSNPENIDSYTYQNGKWQEPQAVQISGGGDMGANVFSLNEIKFETVNNIYKQLQEKAKDIEGAEINGGIYYNLNVVNGQKTWYTGIEGTRGSYSGYFNADGSLKEFKKD